jgi:hypothetical protein
MLSFISRLHFFWKERFFTDEKDRFSPAYDSLCRFEETVNGLFYDSRNPHIHHPLYKTILAASEKVISYSGDRASFFGAPREPHFPKLLIDGENLGNRTGVTGEPFHALQLRLSRNLS